LNTDYETSLCAAAACALQLATEILVDLFTFFSPPAPYTRLFTLTAPPQTEKEAAMQSMDLEEIKAALWEQAYHPCTRVRWGMAQVMAVRKSRGQLLIQLRG
jgi:hypothetical protein